MTVTCALIETICQNTPTYGLAFFLDGKPIETIPDITLDRARLESLCAAINGGELDELHIRDVVEDAVAMWA